MSVWKVDAALSDEAEFQLDLIRDLKKKHGISEDAFELFSTKLLFVFKRILWGEHVSEEDEGETVWASLVMLGALTDFFKDFECAYNELENKTQTNKKMVE